jgi:hypothetical protein
VVFHSDDPPAERPDLKKGERKPGDPETAEYGNNRPIQMPRMSWIPGHNLTLNLNLFFVFIIFTPGGIRRRHWFLFEDPSDGGHGEVKPCPAEMHTFGTGKVFHCGKRNPAWWTEYFGRPDYGPIAWDKELSRPKTRNEQKWLVEGKAFKKYAEKFAGLDRFFLDGKKFKHAIENEFGTFAEAFSGQDTRLFHSESYRYISDNDRDLVPDEKAANWAAEVLGRRHNDPFFLAVGFINPHTPLNAPQEYFDLYPLDKLQLPPGAETSIEGCARAMLEHCPYGFLRYDMLLEGGVHYYKKWLQSYLACVSFMDDQLGVILDALEASPYFENTVVVFTSDNGYHMGERSYLFKDSLWEEACQVPLVISAPDVTAADQECSWPVSLIDTYPTLIHLCGLPAEPNSHMDNANLDGFSMRNSCRNLMLKAGKALKSL